MRILVVMRGAPGAGKSTFINEFGWKPYTLSADDIRLMFESPIVDHKNKKLIISQKNDKKVWDFLLSCLESRMEKGEFCVVDATHSKSQDFLKYKKLIEKYRYRGYCIDFSDISMEECKKRNRSRDEYKFVPDEVIENIYSRMLTQEVPSYFEKFSHLDEQGIYLKLNAFIPKNVDEYEKIVAFGDIHGCYEPLKKYFDENPFSKNVFYVFCGDYVDRGIQNKEVLNWLIDHYENKNVVLLQGNHEKWLLEYSNGYYDEEIKEGHKNLCRSSEFFNNTIPQIKDISRKSLRQLCRKFSLVCDVFFDRNEFIFTHAGIGFMYKDLTKLSAETFIKGGKYEDPIDEWWQNNESEIYQIHGHRNILDNEINKYDHSLNLCDKIEEGGYLRIVEIEKGN